MIVRLTALILLCTPSLTQTAEIPQLITLTDVGLGDSVTFVCEVPEDLKSWWYKQSLGHMPQSIASHVLGKTTLSVGFDLSRFTVKKEATKFFLIIRNVSKEDEAAYFCETGTTYSQTFTNGTFLAVKDHDQQKSVYVKQIPKKASVLLGDSVTLQCSLLSKNKENAVQCSDEDRVYWFRAGLKGFDPTIIYTLVDTDEDLERRCVYSLPKIIQNSSDAGTYYCAVVTCGQILLGEGTKVETRPELGPVFLVLGVLLTCCVAVIVLLILYFKRTNVCQHCKGLKGRQRKFRNLSGEYFSTSCPEGEISAPNHVGLSMSTVDQANYSTVTYAAVDFSSRRVKREKRKRRESAQDCVYAAVRSDSHTQQQLSA